MNDLKRFKKKLAPVRVDDISSDKLVHLDDEIMVTSFTLDYSKMGTVENLSYFDFKQGFSITEKFDKDGQFMYWYCDVLDFEWSPERDSLTITDLILDFVVFPDGRIDICDLVEMAKVIEQDQITKEQAGNALKNLNNLVGLAYHGKIPPDRMKPYSKVQFT